MSRKTKAQIEQERLEKERKLVEAERRKQEKKQREAAKRREQERRAWLRAERAKPRVEIPSAYSGESIYVHKRVYEAFMKRKDIRILSIRPYGGQGGWLTIDYESAAGMPGRLELKDLGPMPAG